MEDAGLTWPDLAIGVGRRAVQPLLALRSASQRARPGRPTFIIQVQKPILPAEPFDLIIVPQHDELSGPNVLAIKESIHRITVARLATESTVLRAIYANLPARRLAVLLGGNNKVLRFGIEQTLNLDRKPGCTCRARRAGADDHPLAAQRPGCHRYIS